MNQYRDLEEPVDPPIWCVLRSLEGLSAPGYRRAPGNARKSGVLAAGWGGYAPQMQSNTTTYTYDARGNRLTSTDAGLAQSGSSTTLQLRPLWAEDSQGSRERHHDLCGSLP